MGKEASILESRQMQLGMLALLLLAVMSLGPIIRCFTPHFKLRVAVGKLIIRNGCKIVCKALRGEQ